MNPGRDRGLQGHRRPARIVVLGAGGRDFHNFNTYFRDNPSYEVVAFTAAQIPYISNRRYPAEFSGPLYPHGIPIHPEEDLAKLLSGDIDQVFFSYSDVSHQEVMDKASRVLSAGKAFALLGPLQTMIESRLPVISVCAVRTGCGKSVITRKVASLLRAKGIRVSVIRHPMAYCEFRAVSRFSNMEDVDRETCTVEEREEFEPLVELGITVFAGVDYEKVLRAAEEESEVILWDGGNNDFPFIKPDREIVLLDALRPGHEMSYFPGEVNLRRAHVLIVTKVNESKEGSLALIRSNILAANPSAEVLEAPSVIHLDHPERVEKRRVLVVEDGPTITHGGMEYGAGGAVSRGMAGELIDPRPHAVGSLKEVYRLYPHIGKVLPAMGYSQNQLKDLEETIRRSKPEAVVLATPADLTKRIRIDAPAARVHYDFEVDLSFVTRFLADRGVHGTSP